MAERAAPLASVPSWSLRAAVSNGDLQARKGKAIPVTGRGGP
jgi:hypothetical protein